LFKQWLLPPFICAALNLSTDAEVKDALQSAYSLADDAMDEVDKLSKTSMLVGGTYVGDGGKRTITIGFKPYAVIICKQLIGDYNEEYTPGICSAFVEATSQTWKNSVTFTDDGFEVGYGDSIYAYHIDVNLYKRTYSYIAIKEALQ
jgi:hypothetical protein